MTVESDTKFEEKLALDFKDDMTNLVNFNPSSGKSENLHFDVLCVIAVCIYIICTFFINNFEHFCV